MKPRSIFALALASGLSLYSTHTARATVSLVIQGGIGGVVTANRGDSVPFTLNLVSTLEQTTGVDYFLQVSPAASGHLTITNRDFGATVYSNFYFPDATVEAMPSSILDPANNHDLGASIVNLAAPTGIGTFLVAMYTLLISPTLPNGTYTISTFSQAGTGWVGPAPTFPDNTFTSHGSLSLVVIPEPGVGALLGCAGLALLRRRR